ncbi:MAG: DUF3048 domain-containing protein [Lachnospiraceae bacterium]|jgi:hypothetical protein|nr:DUF3048 domain-containing protein [Lachnospiraceae bacterium]
MKKYRYLISLILLTLFLCSCSSKETLPNLDSIPTAQPIDKGDTETPTTPGTEAVDPTTDVQTPSTPTGDLKRSRLTNEWVSAQIADTRPIAVMTPQEDDAIPHYSLSKASILYEVNVEGRMTRMMAVYENWWELEKIGNIRSLRSYYDYWVTEWDAVLLHYGETIFDEDFLNDPNTQDLDGNAEGVAFFRSTDRSSPHNGFATGEGIQKAFEQKGYSFTYRGLADEQHYLFADETSPNTLEQYANTIPGNKVDMEGCYPLTRCYFVYNPDDGLYYRYQHLSGLSDGPHVDESGTQLSFANLLIQNTYYEVISDPYLYFKTFDTTRDGWFFTQGKGIHVTWEKTTDYGATRYYDDNGDEIVLNTGKTMVLIVEDGDQFNYE